MDATTPFQFASDQAKQILTLSTSVLGFGIAFQSQIQKVVARPVTLKTGFALLLASVAAGIFNLGALTYGVQQVVENKAPSQGIMAPNIMLLGSTQFFCFVAGIAVVAYAVLNGAPPSDK